MRAGFKSSENLRPMRRYSFIISMLRGSRLSPSPHGHGRFCLAGLQRAGRDCYVGSMPSPAGHLIAGVAIAWAVESAGPLRRRAMTQGRRAEASPAVTPLVLACAALALAPDLDILFASHRTFTHSIAAAGLAAVFGGAIARALGAPGVATGLTCGLVVGSHIVLDWLGRDGSTPRGLMALWPFSSRTTTRGSTCLPTSPGDTGNRRSSSSGTPSPSRARLSSWARCSRLAWWTRQRRRSGGGHRVQTSPRPIRLPTP